MPGTILITGGAQRFGRELALALANTGYRVVITYRRERDNLVDLSDAGIRCLKADFKMRTPPRHLLPRRRVNLIHFGL